MSSSTSPRSPASPGKSPLKPKPNRSFPHLTTADRPQLQDVARLLKEGKAKRVIVMAGAGISTSAGIPDFRSPGTGLYDNLQKYNLPYPEAIFDLDYLSERPEAFYTLAKELYPGSFKPTTTHYFFRLLQEKGVLKGVWTQNIDTLERIAGIDDDHIVEAHGSFAEAECLNCKKRYTQNEIKPRILSGEVVRCEEKGCKGKKEALIKPRIVFFGEGLPDRFFDRMSQFRETDLLIVLGTSLTVQPFAGLLHRVGPACPRLLINLESVGEVDHPRDKGFDFTGFTGPPGGIRDVRWLGQVDEGVEELCRLVGEGWDEDLKRLKDDVWRRIDEEERRNAPKANSTEEAEESREGVIEAVGEAAETEKRREEEAAKEEGAVSAPKEGKNVAEEAVEALTDAIKGVDLSAEKVVEDGTKKGVL
ncbi:hypothetical protein JCM8547_004213 [Rhodosporidiobolus lusitaniae]